MISIEVLKQNPELAEKITFSLSGNDLIEFAREIAHSLKGSTPTPAPAPSNEKEVLMTIDEVSEFLQISRVQLWRWQKKKILVPVKIGNAVRYRKSDLNKAMERRSWR